MKRSELSANAHDLLENPRNILGAAHEYAETHADVIYPARAHAFLSNCSNEEIAEAQEEADACGCQSTDYNALACLLSLFIIRGRYIGDVRLELEEFRDDGDASEADLRAIREIIAEGEGSSDA